MTHDWRSYLWLDFDLSGLPCGPQPKKAKKDISVVKKHHWTSTGTRECDSIPRNSLVRTVFRQSPYGHCLQPAVLATENALELVHNIANAPFGALMVAEAAMSKCVGCSPWLSVVPKASATVVPTLWPDKSRRWDPYGDAWLGEVRPPVDYGCPVQVFVKRRLKKGKFRTATMSQR